MKPYLSILIDTYNHEKFIEQAINSVLEQDINRSDIEIIVVDDGSTDQTPEIIKKYSSHLRYIRKDNGGQATAFNLGIAEARGEIIAFLDGDDWWVPEKLRRVVECLEQDPELGAIGHGIIETYEGSHSRRICTHETTKIKFSNIQNISRFLGVRSQLGTSRFTARKSLLEKILPFPEELTVEADEYMFTFAPALSSVLVLNECLTYYRLHGGNLYQFQDGDERKIRRKAQVHQVLSQALPERLRETGLDEQSINLLNAHSQILVDRHRLEYEGGWPWETLQTELLARQLQASNRYSVKRLLLSQFFLLLSCLMPPPWFYKLRGWYSKKIVKLAQTQIFEDVIL